MKEQQTERIYSRHLNRVQDHEIDFIPLFASGDKNLPFLFKGYGQPERKAGSARSSILCPLFKTLSRFGIK